MPSNHNRTLEAPRTPAPPAAWIVPEQTLPPRAASPRSAASRGSQASRRSHSSSIAGSRGAGGGVVNRVGSSASSRRAGSEVVRSSSVPQLSLSSADPSSGKGMQHAPWGQTMPGQRLGTAVDLLGHHPVSNLPGYTGHIPGKEAENVLGCSHVRANALAAAACSRRGELFVEHDYVTRKNPYGLLQKRRGGDVPGYTGHIPGKHATSVFGQTFAHSNEVATQVRREQAVGRTHRPPMLQPGAPVSWVGNVSAYVDHDHQ